MRPAPSLSPPAGRVAPVRPAPPAGGATAGGAASAEPLNRVELIAPAAPGSGWDQTSRAVQASLKTDNLAKSIEVRNVPGASGTVALAQVAPQKGKKDLLVASGLAMMSGIITNGTSVTLDDLTPLARVVGEYEAIVTPKDSPSPTSTRCSPPPRRTRSP